jgi:hypothetical protein
VTKIHLVFDLESTADHHEHRRYQASEHYTPRAKGGDSRRRGQRGQQDPLTTPRWPFQVVLALSVMKCVAGDGGNIVPAEMTTWSLKNMDEKQILTEFFRYLSTMPAASVELVSFGGEAHDLQILRCRAMAHSLTLPPGFEWLAFPSPQKSSHLDLSRVLTNGLKMRQCHLSEFAAVINMPSKFVAASWSITKLARAGEWKTIEEVCESDCITTAFLFASWKGLIDGRVPVWTVHDRICGKVQELRPNRSYIKCLVATRGRLYDDQMRQAKARLGVIGLPSTAQIRRPANGV